MKVTEKFKNTIKSNFKKFGIKIFDGIYGLIRENYALSYIYIKISLAIFAKRTSIQKYSISGVSVYCDTNGILKTVHEESINRDVCIPEYYRQSKEKIRTFKAPEIYTVYIPRVSVIGGSSFILKDSRCLYDFFEHDNVKHYDLKFGSLLNYHLDKREAAVLRIVSKISIKKGVFLLGFASSNYYHFLIEVMAKFKYINEMSPSKDFVLLIDEEALQVEQFNQILRKLNINNYEIFQVSKNTQYEVDELLYVSDCVWMPINVSGNEGLMDQECLLSKNAIYYVDEKLKESLSIQDDAEDSPKKVFLGRRTMKNRRLVNEEEVARLFCENGFTVIYPETLTLENQIKLFSNADIIASTTGAALTNIVFSSPSTILICIVPKRFNFNLFSTIAYFKGVKSIFIDAKVINKGQKISLNQFTVDLDLCKELLNEVKTYERKSNVVP